MKKQLLLVDGHGLAFRGFYALPENLSAGDGTPTNAILGFMNMMLKAVDRWPAYGLGIFFDVKGPTKRHLLFDEYKGNRKPTPPKFAVQVPIIMELCKAMGFPVFTREGVEADDMIVSTARAGAAGGWEVSILSADKDLFQIIGDGISVIRPSHGVTDFTVYDNESFVAKYGFAPSLMADYLALVGDAVDNIPGVPGIGEKSAIELVGRYGPLEEIYANLGELTKARRTKLENGRELAFKSRELIVPQDTEAAPESEMLMGGPDMDKLRPLCTRLGLKKILARFGTDEGSAIMEEVETEPAAVSCGEKFEGTEAPLEELLAESELSLAQFPESESLYCIAARDGRNARIDMRSSEESGLFSDWSDRPGSSLYMYGYRAFLSKWPGTRLPGVDAIYDLETANYLLHPDQGGAKGIARSLGEKLPEGRLLALNLFQLYGRFAPQLEKFGLEKVMRGIDLPLAAVLAKMHLTGIHADGTELEAMDRDLEASITETKAKITEYTGEDINLASPKQVGELLFEKLMLPPIKKNHTGYSTDAYVLEELSKLPEPMCTVPKLIIKYREESKIQTGFVQPFARLSRESGGVIRSTFDNLATGTGRLASYDPNVQNMPVFGIWPERFRSCFTPRSEDSVFVSADYSQIELRVLAELTGEEKLLNAFREGLDIHLETASWVFGLPAEDITHEQRRFAKVVNFGLLYGMSSFGLAQRLSIPRPAAAQIVDRYFSVLPKVREYISESVETAKKRGYTLSMFGRIRPLSEVTTVEGRGNSPINRVAVNTPIQSAASDIAKIALFRFDNELSKKFPSAYTVLQIHDSIVCECSETDADGVEELLVSTMEGVCSLNVPLKAEAKRGRSLKDL